MESDSTSTSCVNSHKSCTTRLSFSLSPLSPPLPGACNLYQSPGKKSGLCQVGFETLQSLGPTLLHSCKIRRGLGSHLYDARPHSLFRLPILFHEGHRVQYIEHWVAIRVQRRTGEHKPLGLHNLLIHARHWIDDPVGATHVNADGAARPGVQLAYRVSESVRPPPLAHALRIGPRLKYEFPRGIKHACRNNLLPSFSLG